MKARRAQWFMLVITVIFCSPGCPQWLGAQTAEKKISARQHRRKSGSLSGGRLLTYGRMKRERANYKAVSEKISAHGREQ